MPPIGGIAGTSQHFLHFVTTIVSVVNTRDAMDEHFEAQNVTLAGIHDTSFNHVDIYSSVNALKPTPASVF